MSYEVKYEKRYVSFYPIISNFPVEERDDRQYKDLPEDVYGKLLIGMAGYQPIWMYKTVKKNEIIQKN